MNVENELCDQQKVYYSYTFCFIVMTKGPVP